MTARSWSPPPNLNTLIDSLSPHLYLAVPIVLILLRVAFSQAKRFLPLRSKHNMSYSVKWNRERLYFALPPPDAKLAVIRKELADYTQLPYDSFKLVHAGAVMKDDNAPISSYGIKADSTIAIIGTGDTLPASSKIPSSAQPKASSSPRTEETTISQIRTEMTKVRTKLQPDVDAFLASLPAKPLEEEHARLGELLLQSLLRLDALHSEGEWEMARKERKGAVKEVQALLDRLDGGWRARARA